MSRSARALAPPNPDHDWSTFPTEITTSRPLFRAHGVEFGPWFFASGPGRFDLSDPVGTFYAADDLEVAVRERLGPTWSASPAIPRAMAEEFQVTELSLTGGLRLADIDDRAAARFGMTNELATMDDYALAQAWAATLHGAGFDGIRYRARFTPDKSSNAVALFGEAGSRDWPFSSVIDGVTACRAIGLQILETPETLTTITPPALSKRRPRR